MFIRDRGRHDGPHCEITPPTFQGPTVTACALCELAYINAEAVFDAAVEQAKAARFSQETVEPTTGSQIVERWFFAQTTDQRRLREKMAREIDAALADQKAEIERLKNAQRLDLKTQARMYNANAGLEAERDALRAEVERLTKERDGLYEQLSEVVTPVDVEGYEWHDDGQPIMRGTPRLTSFIAFVLQSAAEFKARAEAAEARVRELERKGGSS